jgi:hypothetical protein
MICKNKMTHSNRYKTYIISDTWRSKSKKCRNLNRNRCVLFPWLRSNHAHHLHYRNLESELPVRDIVPLSKIAHNLVHIEVFNYHPLWGKSPLRIPFSWFLRVFYVISIVFWQTIGRFLN